MDLRDKIVVITGGSLGFGKALAHLLATEGCRVVIASNNKETLESSAKELSVDCCLTDVASYEEVKKLGDYAVEKYGRIDLWVNNAGIQIAPSFLEEVDREKLHRLFEVNFFGYVYGCQVALSRMKEQREGGTIININSTAGLEGKPELSAYVSSKFAVKGMTESIRKELIDSNIRVYGVYPGGMQTEIYKEKYPADLQEYMQVDDVAKGVINNLKVAEPVIDLIIKRPTKS
jgi:NAD(P)-dependent dehydrogenase (short-subunit alcohol dehydrogenase family)